MLVRLKKVFLVVCCFVSVFSFPVSVWAMSNKIPEAEYLEWAQVGDQFYNPYECNNGEDTTTFCTAPTGNQITWIGDSYSVGAQSIIEQELSGISFGDSVNDANSQIQVSKTVSGGNSSNPSGFTILKKIIDEDKLKPYLVFALGTNDGWSDGKAEEFKKLMSEHDSTKVVFVTSKIPGNDYAESNKILKKLADSSDNYSLADWAAVEKNEWFDSDPERIHPSAGDGYKVWVETIKNALPQNCMAGLLPGTNSKQKIWNYFVKAEIEGVSNNPAVIAGILGNLKLESDLDPFVVGSGTYYGLYQEMNDGLKSAIRDAGLSQYWGQGQSAPQDAIDRAIKVELDFLTKSNKRFDGSDVSFVAHINDVDDKSSPESYADLFLVAVEGAVGGADQLQDSKVKAFAESAYSHGGPWQAANKRREYARDMYDRLSSLAVPTTNSYSGSATSSGSNITAESSSGYTKYEELTDSQIRDLAEVAYAESGDDKVALAGYLSIMANIYEENNAKLSSKGLVKYVKESSEISNMFSKTSYMNDKSDVNTRKKSASYIVDTARNVLMKGNRTLPKQILIFDKVDDIISASMVGTGADAKDVSQWVKGKTSLENKQGARYLFYSWASSGAKDEDKVAFGYYYGNEPTDAVSERVDTRGGDCPAKTKYGVRAGIKIAQTAVKMAWPVQAEQDDKEHVGQCYNESAWVDYDFSAGTCYHNPRPFYREECTRLNMSCATDMYEDCGYFVATVLHSAGMADETTKYKMTGQPTMAGAGKYSPGDMEESEDWDEIENNGTEENLKPGDVMIDDSHVFIYVGQYGGSYGNIAEASRGDRVGLITTIWELSRWRIYRHKDAAIDGGLTQEQAEKLAYNYNNNVGSWIDTVAGPSNYCIGDYPGQCRSRVSNCVLLSAFFAEMFAGVERQGWPNGAEVVDRLKSLGFETGKEPRPFAIFSTTSYNTTLGHTGLVVSVDGDTMSTVEAGYPNMNATYFSGVQYKNYPDMVYAYLDSDVDYEKLKEYLGE